MLQSLKKLFSTDQTARPLFESVILTARQPHWYLQGGVPDTVDGRFALLSTLTALAILRLEVGSDNARRASVNLIECFIHEMDSEVRQMGIGDPTLSKQVGGMVSALGARIGRFRERLEAGDAWNEAVNDSLYRSNLPDAAAQNHALAGIHAFWAKLKAFDEPTILAGKWA